MHNTIDCIFCKIAKKEITSEIIYEDNYTIAFKDINPQAKIHLLVIPKKHYKNILELPLQESQHILNAIKNITNKLEISNFRIVNNCGVQAGQTVFHLHFHIIGGEKLSGKMA